MKYISICNNCGIEFEKRYKNSNRKYCSQKCFKENGKYILACVICGDLFESKAINAKYCIKCKTRKCSYCDKLFELNNSELKGTKYNKPRKYCSKECFYKGIKGKKTWNKEEGISVICPICNISFNVWKSRGKTVKYCSKKCMDDAKSLIMGENHPLWKGGYDLYGRLLSKNGGSFYRNRRIVLERDNFTCQYCGFKGKSNYMDVHHIISVRKFGKSIPENMITLCRKCHNNADKGKIEIKLLQQKIIS